MTTAPIYDRTMHEARTYWRDRLHEMSFAAQVALDHPRPRGGRPDPATLEREFDREVDGVLQRLTGGAPALLYTALVSGLRICCYKYTGRPRTTLLSASRRTEGGGANLVPIVGAVDRQDSFKDVLLATRELLADAFKHQTYPFSRVLLDLGSGQQPEHLSLVASMVGFSAEVADETCDIAVRFGRVDGVTTAGFRFDRRIYDQATIERFFDCLDAVLRRGLVEMATPIAELDPHRDDGDDGDRAGPPVHELIAARANEHPGRAAIVEGGRVTTYESLVADADRIAAVLAGLALDRRRPVGLLIDMGAELVVSMLAVMRAGMAFAPVRALTTGGGLGETLGALGCESILCRPELLASLDKVDGSLGNVTQAVTVGYSAQSGSTQSGSVPGGSAPNGGGDVAVLEVGRTAIAAGMVRDAAGERTEHEAAAGERAEGEAAAGDEPGRRTAAVFVRPRRDGLELSSVSHDSLARLVGWLNGRFGIGPPDRCLLSPCLDLSEQLYDTLGLLAGGASVEIAGPSEVSGLTGLLDRLLAEPITVWDLPSGLALNLLAEIRARRERRADLVGPRAILLSGEKQCTSLADELRRCFPAARILGLYASPAVGIWSAYFPFDVGLDVDSGAAAGPLTACGVPGFPHRVVNAAREPAPPHTVGDLLLGGSEPDREPVDTGLRAARLGGSGLRWLRAQDHVLEKRGCRIELTDVEAVLCRDEHVHAAEVTVVPAGPRGVDREVAAFVIADQEHVTAEQVRDLLVRSDAVDLVPDRVVLLDEFPLTTDGAIDQDALIARLRPDSSGGDRAGAENEEVKKRLRPIWLEALQVDEVGDNDSFFALGGNSLRATILIARIRDEFGVDLSVQDFFREPTIGGVGWAIVARPSSPSEPEERPGVRSVSRERYRMRAQPPVGGYVGDGESADPMSGSL